MLKSLLEYFHKNQNHRSEPEVNILFFQVENNAIGQLETAMIFDETATAYNIIVTENGSFIISKYDAIATNDNTTVDEVPWPNDTQSSTMRHQQEVIVLNTTEIEEPIAYERYAS